MRKLLLALLLFPLPLLAQTGAVTGVALDGVGNTVAGATITVCPNGSSGIPCSPVTASTTSNGQGQFSVTVPVGTYTVTVFRTGVVATSSTVVVAPSNITVANNVTYSGTVTFTGAVTATSIDAIQFVDGVTNTTVQQAINKLPSPGGGVVYVPPGTYVGPATIPSNTHLLCLSYWFNPASFGGTTDNGTGCHLTYSGNQTFTSLSNIEISGFWLDFSATNGTGLTLTSVQWSRFVMRIDCFSSAICLTVNTTGTGVPSQSSFNKFDVLELNCNASECLKLSGGSSTAFVTSNKFGRLTLNGAGTFGPGLMELTQFTDNSFDTTLLNVTNAAGNGIIINNSATPNADVQADNNYFGSIKAIFPISPTGYMLKLNASAGTYIGHFDGVLASQIVINGSAATMAYTVGGAGAFANDQYVVGRVCVGAASATSGCPAAANLNGDIAANRLLSSATINGAGLQIFNTTTTCTTGASVGATCTTAAISLPVAEADTSYRVACTGKGLTNVPVVIATANSSATQFTITIAALTAAAASFASYDCVAGHN